MPRVKNKPKKEPLPRFLPDDVLARAPQPQPAAPETTPATAAPKGSYMTFDDDDDDDDDGVFEDGEGTSTGAGVTRRKQVALDRIRSDMAGRSDGGVVGRRSKWLVEGQARLVRALEKRRKKNRGSGVGVSMAMVERRRAAGGRRPVRKPLGQ
ncbi:hypothetical protein PYCC9005_000672 [Savitreella phatthalungensis]